LNDHFKVSVDPDVVDFYRRISWLTIKYHNEWTITDQ
jgi:hypothetical protein